MSVLGIDFGTSQSCMAAARNHGIDILCNEVSQRFTPSLVGFGTKCRFIGEGAASQEMSNMRNTVGSIKRLIGLSHDDPAVAIEQSYINSELCAAGNEVGVKVQYLGETKVFSATQLCAMFLGRLKQLSEKELKSPVHDVVVSVPIWFTPSQRQRLKDACEIAGLNALRTINENTASALLYGITKTDLPEASAPRKIIILDIGASSTTSTAVSFSKGRLEIKGTSFNKNMGGRDLDKLLVDHFAREIKEKKGIDVLKLAKPLMRLRAGIEKVKKMLSSNMEAPLNIESIYEDIDVNLVLTRAEFQAYAEPFVGRIIPLIDTAIQRAGWTPADVTCVETVGGTTRIPMVRECIQSFFERPDILSFTINQDEAVARGSALMCAIVSPIFKVREFEIKDIASYGFALSYLADPPKTDSTNLETCKDSTDMTESVPQVEKRMLVFDSNATVPSSKMLLFNVTKPCLSLDSYLDASGNNSMCDKTLSASISSQRVTYTVKNIPQPSAGLKIRVRFHPDHTFQLEQAQGLIEEIVEVPAEVPIVEKDIKVPNNVLTGKEDLKNEETNKEEKDDSQEVPTQVKNMITKKITKKIDLQVEIEVHGSLERTVVINQREEEKNMINRDIRVIETEFAKNSLEEYIYESRSKISGAWRDFLDSNDAKSLLKMANEAEEWMYSSEGEDSTKEIYETRRAQLSAIGSPADDRRREAEGRGHSIQLLFSTLDNYSIRLSDPAQTHWLPKEEVSAALLEIEKTRKTVEKQHLKQAQLPATVAPIVTCSELDAKRSAVQYTAEQLLGRPKPIVKPTEEKPLPDTQKVEENVDKVEEPKVAVAADGEKMEID